ncbi:MAG: RNA methyltransferase [Bacteroidales bacterium]
MDKKKFRDEHNLFVAEGIRIVTDLLRMGAGVKLVVSSNDKFENTEVEIIRCKASDMEKISLMKTVPEVIALVEIPDYSLSISDLYNKLTICLDGIQDPGNMGTIVRIANWFGIEHIICSTDCADIYNPKVVQASMGALIGVKVHYLELQACIKELKKNQDYNVYGSFMDGNSIYDTRLNSNGLLVMGNEGKGISDKVRGQLTSYISIPTFANQFKGAESLNVGVAAGIILSEFKRQALLNKGN